MHTRISPFLFLFWFVLSLVDCRSSSAAHNRYAIPFLPAHVGGHIGQGSQTHCGESHQSPCGLPGWVSVALGCYSITSNPSVVDRSIPQLHCFRIFNISDCSQRCITYCILSGCHPISRHMLTVGLSNTLVNRYRAFRQFCYLVMHCIDKIILLSVPKKVYICLVIYSITAIKSIECKVDLQAQEWMWTWCYIRDY